MTNKNTRNFTPLDDALIVQQPVSGIGIKPLAKMIRTTQRCSYVGLANLVFRWTSVMIMTRLSTRGRSVAAINSSTRY
jgi:hypothetical protein